MQASSDEKTLNLCCRSDWTFRLIRFQIRSICFNPGQFVSTSVNLFQPRSVRGRYKTQVTGHCFTNTESILNIHWVVPENIHTPPRKGPMTPHPSGFSKIGWQNGPPPPPEIPFLSHTPWKYYHSLWKPKIRGVTKHRNGMERNGIYWNKPEYTGTRQNDAGMKRNGQEWYRNTPERHRNEVEWHQCNARISHNSTRM